MWCLVGVLAGRSGLPQRCPSSKTGQPLPPTAFFSPGATFTERDLRQ